MTEIRDPRRAAALVAMGIIVPGADTPQMLWDNVINNRTFFRQAQASDFGADPAGFLQTGEPAQDKAYSLSGSWTPDRKFDFEHLALPKSFDPDEADASLNHWLYAVMEALSGANLKGHDPSKIGVIAGHVILPTRAMSEATVSLYGREATRDWEFNPFRPPPHTNPFRAVGYSAKLASETFGFTGPSFTVDAACASSLYAVKLALNHLRDSSLTAVVTGGLAKADPLFTQLGFSQLRALSHSGVCRPFSPDSDGLVVGSGAVALLLKRLDRAIEDKDDVICVISGVGLSNDRSGNLLAPDPEGQKRAMDNAFRDACLPDDQAPGLFEAHGTSTPLGDAKEVSAIKDFLTSRRCSFPPVIGSVKGNVGHLLSAAGAASLAKTALAVSKGVLPPTAGITGNKTAPNLELDKHPILEILPKAKPWPKGSARIAAVNAFGFGGVNAQAVLEEFVVENWAIEGSAAGGKKSVGAAVKKLSAKTEAKQTSKISSKNSKAGGKRAANAPDAPNSPQASPVSLKSPTDSLKAPADLLKEPAGSLKAPTDRSLDEATVSKDASGLQDISQKDISQQNTSQQDSSQKDAPQREASQQNNSQKDASRQDSPNSVRAFLISARTVLAPWPNYDSLARYWLTPEEPPLASTRRLGSLKATGYFFDNLTIDVKKFHLPPKELADALPQQTLALKAAVSALTAAGIDPDNWPEGLDRDRFGVFMGVDIDPRSSDYALRWLAPPRATDALLEKNLISPQQRENFIATIRKGSPAPLTHDRVLGALGSFVASRLSRFLGAGGPAFTLSEEKDSGLRALHEAMSFLAQDLVDIAVVGVVDTFGDPKTAALAPKTVWVEGAAALVLASPKVASVLKPLAALTLTDQHSRLGPLSGIFSLNRSAFYLRHHLKPLGRGRGFAYWLRNPGDPPRSLSGPSYEIHEHIDTKPHSLTAPSDPIRPDVWFFLKAVDQNDLKDKLVELSLFAEGNSSKDLYVLSREFWNQQLSKPGKPQLALLARDNRELLSHIKRSIAGEIDRDFKPRILQAPSEPIRGDLAFVFPGQTNYYKGLGRSLGASFPDVMHKLETECRNPIGFFQNHLIGETPFRRPSTKEVILSHVSFGLIGSTLLKRFSLKPQAVLSYSLGEMAALIATGIWPDRDEFCRDLLESELFTSELVGELTCPKTFWNWPRHKHVKWITGTIQKPAELVRHAIDSLPPPHRQRVFILLINSHSEVDVGGEESAVQALTQSLEAPFYQIEDVPSFHSPILKAVEDKFRKFVSRETLEQKDLRFYSPYHAKVIDQTSDAVADSLTLQSIHGHDFPKSIEQAYQDGIRFFIEIGPGNATSRMIKNILADKPHVAQSLASTPIDEGWSGLNQVLAELWLSGYPLVLEKLLLFPCLIPDKRFEAPIKLSPPQLSWPIHGETQTKSAESEFAANKLSASDYLMWLEAQTSSLPPQPQAKSPVPEKSGAHAQFGEPAQRTEESSLSAPAPPLMPQSDKAAAAAVAASKIAAAQPATKTATKPASKTRGRAAKSDSILSPPERDFLEGVPSAGVPSAASASVG
ncbi:MAG: hypothetical protein LBT62_07175, partial [Deltaproteobacteria bacterium]|nr:hypothetical protein [Deltaproteobacteria bacterium]